MAIPTIRTIEGQGGNIEIFLPNGQPLIIQVRNWKIRKIFKNSDVTVTCSGGWAEYKRVLAAWDFTADWPYDATAARVGSYDGVRLINGIYVPIGLEYPIPAACVFQIGAAGAVTNPGSVAIQYQGNALLSTDQTDNPATDVVHFAISGQGTGVLIGPVAGLIT
jgi:hypothetical protein